MAEMKEATERMVASKARILAPPTPTWPNVDPSRVASCPWLTHPWWPTRRPEKVWPEIPRQQCIRGAGRPATVVRHTNRLQRLRCQRYRTGDLDRVESLRVTIPSTGVEGGLITFIPEGSSQPLGINDSAGPGSDAQYDD